MENKIFLLKNQSKFSTNKRSFIGLNLENNARLASSTDLSETISLYDLYNDERNNCENFRLIFNINPICSNILFNNVTEIVKDEGSDNCSVIDTSGITLSNFVNKTNPVDRIQALRDTEYSKEYDYHCGYDIFNNHILRANNFPFIGPINSGSSANSVNVFNTFKDYSRDNDGNIITALDYLSSGGTMIKMHVYNTDTLDQMDTAFADKCEEKDGWFGFYNRTLIDIPNAKSSKHGKIDKMINSVICSKSACSFVDMYPDRSLFSFSPKYNSYRNRAEKNWDYCITYPYESDKDTFNMINGNSVNAVKIYSYALGTTTSGVQVVRLKTLFKHNLKKGDYVNLYLTDKKSDTEPELVGRILVRSLGNAERDNSDKIFNIYFDDIKNVCKIDVDKIKKKGGNNAYFYFKKNVNGCESEYYFRKFKKLYSDEPSGITPHSEINKLSFAKNVFGDELTQILYTDDINITGLVDNLGRPLSSLYLTIVKRNKGHELWYSKTPVYSSSEIEYSHCFGEVTSGLDLPSDYYDYNVHKLHNIDLSDIDSMKKIHTASTIVISYDVENEADDKKADYSQLQNYSKTITSALSTAAALNEEQKSVNGSDEILLASELEVSTPTIITRKTSGVTFGGTDGASIFNKNTITTLKDLQNATNSTFSRSGSVTPITISASYEEGTKDVFSNFLTQPSTLESDITIDGMDEFLGDISEFNKFTYTETTIDYVYHRFNTAQREFCESDEYADVLEDNIIFDDYFNYSAFTVATNPINLADKIGTSAQTLYLGNLNPEGYFYNPHYRIKIREINDNLSSLIGYQIEYNGDNYGLDEGITVEYKDISGNFEYKIPYSENYNMKAGNSFAFYNLNTDKIYWGSVKEVYDDYILVDCGDDIPGDDFRVNLIFLYYIPGDCPLYAKFVFSKDLFVWREFITPSMLTNSSDLFNTPFSNGAFYLEKNVNFFLRRQDPHGEYYMSNPEENPKRPSAFASQARKFKKFSIGKFTFNGIKNIDDLFNSSCE